MFIGVWCLIAKVTNQENYYENSVLCDGKIGLTSYKTKNTKIDIREKTILNFEIRLTLPGFERFPVAKFLVPDCGIQRVGSLCSMGPRIWLLVEV